MKLKLYHQDVEIGDVDWFIPRFEDTYFMRLRGISLDSAPGNVQLNPVYVPFFSFQRNAGQIVIDFSLWSEGARRLILQRRRPYVALHHLTGTKFEEEEV